MKSIFHGYLQVNLDVIIKIVYFYTLVIELFGNYAGIWSTVVDGYCRP